LTYQKSREEEKNKRIRKINQPIKKYNIAIEELEFTIDNQLLISSCIVFVI